MFIVTLLAGLILATTSGLVRLGASDQGTQPTNQTARRAYDLLAEGFGPGFNGPIPIVVDVNSDKQAPQKIYDGVQGLPGRRVGPQAAVQQGEDRRDRLRHAEARRPRTKRPTSSSTASGTRSCPRPPTGGDALAYVSGLTAAFKDIADRIL